MKILLTYSLLGLSALADERLALHNIRPPKIMARSSVEHPADLNFELSHQMRNVLRSEHVPGIREEVYCMKDTCFVEYPTCGAVYDDCWTSSFKRTVMCLRETKHQSRRILEKSGCGAGSPYKKCIRGCMGIQVKDFKNNRGDDSDEKGPSIKIQPVVIETNKSLPPQIEIEIDGGDTFVVLSAQALSARIQMEHPDDVDWVIPKAEMRSIIQANVPSTREQLYCVKDNCLTEYTQCGVFYEDCWHSSFKRTVMCLRDTKAANLKQLRKAKCAAGTPYKKCVKKCIKKGNRPDKDGRTIKNDGTKGSTTGGPIKK